MVINLLHGINSSLQQRSEQHIYLEFREICYRIRNIPLNHNSHRFLFLEQDSSGILEERTAALVPPDRAGFPRLTFPPHLLSLCINSKPEISLQSTQTVKVKVAVCIRGEVIIGEAGIPEAYSKGSVPKAKARTHRNNRSRTVEFPSNSVSTRISQTIEASLKACISRMKGNCRRN